MRNDRLLAPTKWVARAVVPVLTAAFVILFFFPERTMQLWSWMVCPSMSALIMGAGYLAGAYFFTRVSGAREWHRVGVGFLATTVFGTLLMITTIVQWDGFNHDHVSFWAWLVLYASTPLLLPILWIKNRRTDPGTRSVVDTTIPRRLRTAVGVGGALQLAFAAVMFVAPDVAAEAWAWPLEPTTSRSISAFVAFPAVTWFCFLFDSRWSSFRITSRPQPSAWCSSPSERFEPEPSSGRTRGSCSTWWDWSSPCSSTSPSTSSWTGGQAVPSNRVLHPSPSGRPSRCPTRVASLASRRTLSLKDGSPCCWAAGRVRAAPPQIGPWHVHRRDVKLSRSGTGGRWGS